MDSLNERDHYVSDGRVTAAGVPMLVCGSLAAALGAGFLLSRLFFSGWYFVVLVPAMAALALAGVLHLLVGLVKCRNYWFAGLLGATAGLFAYGGYFYFCMQTEFPPPFNNRIDLLPTYIAHRMATDVQEDVGKPKALQAQKPAAFLNWMMAAFELAFLVGFTSSFAWNRARRAYSRDLERWARREQVQSAPYDSERLLAAWEAGQLPQALRDAPPAPQQQMSCRFVVEWFDDPERSPLEHPVYASVEDHYKTWGLQTMRRTVLRQVELTTAEALSLRPFLPQLAAKLDVKHPELQGVPTAVVPDPEGTRRPHSSIATVTPVPEPYRQRVLNGSYNWHINLRDLIPLVSLLGGLGVAALGVWSGFKGHYIVCGILSTLGLAGFGWGVYVSQYCFSVYGTRWANARLRSEFAARPNLLVDLSDPAVKYVTIIPRESFAKVKWTMSSDLLLMKIDSARREIRLEGDCDCYVIPAAAVGDCQPICMYHPIDTQRQNQLWMVRLLVRRELGEQELLLSIGQLDWSPQTNRGREQTARETCDEINALTTA